MTYYDVTVFESVWEMIECGVYALPIVGLMSAFLWYMTKKTSYKF